MERRGGTGVDGDVTRTRAFLESLRARRDEGERMPPVGPDIDLTGLNLVRADFAGLDLTGVNLRGLDLSESNLQGARLLGADLEGAILHGCDLSDAELLGANLDGADFTTATLHRTGLGRVSGNSATFFGADATGATFTSSDLTDSDFRTSTLKDARFRETTLDGATFDGAVMREIDLTTSTVDGASFQKVDLFNARLRGVTGYKSANWINADLREVDFTGAWLLRRHALDENFIAEFRGQSPRHELLYKLWWVTSDCGRSIGRWSAWTVLVALIYAGVYTQVEISYGGLETPLSPLYYSVVTFTTLGYGDVLPGSTTAQILAMSEVVLGYFSLGGMMSILSDKIARRAG
ncbi:MAG: pentapeptide repeat-containing protein [Acidimicrobiales bacterium]